MSSITLLHEHPVLSLKPRDHFPVIKNRTILPKRVIPRTMPVTIARKMARTRVNLKTRKKRGTKTTHSSIVRQPVAKSFVSTIRVILPFPFSEKVYNEL
jgi:hypothetical protein